MTLVSTATPRARTIRRQKVDDLLWNGHTIEIGVAYRAIEAEWRVLDVSGTASVFQSFGFVDGWCRHAAGAAGEEPMIVMGRRNGVLGFILPLALTRCGGVRVMRWLAQSHANYGLPLISPDILGRFTSRDVKHLLRQIAKRCGASVVHLDHQPTLWAGHENPFATGSSARLTANDTFVLPLDDDFDRQYQRLFSGKTRSGLKRKRRRLEEEGSVAFDAPSNPQLRQDLLTWFIAQKHAQLAEEGQSSVFDQSAIGDLYRHFVASSPAFEIDRVAVGNEPIAVAMTMRSGRDSCLINTAHLGANFARFSPGALLLHSLIASAHARGVRTFDFGPGAVPYKLEWEPQSIPLMSMTMAVSPLGLPVKYLLAFSVALKRKLKRDDRLRAFAFEARRRLGRYRSGHAQEGGKDTAEPN